MWETWQEGQARIQRETPRVLEQYGFTALRSDEVRQVLQTEDKLAKCETCDGSECLIKTNYFKPVIRVGWSGGLNIAHGYCRHGERLRLLRQCRRLKIPRKMVGKTLDDYEVTAQNEDAVAMAKWFIAEKPDCGLYYFGACGSGKTFLAAIIAQEFIKDLQSVVFGDVPALMEELKRTFDKNPQQETSQDILDEFKMCDLLVLDDIGAGQITEWNVGVLYQIINERYASGKPVIITSNFSPDELEARLRTKDKHSAERIVSRICGMCEVGNLGDSDRRRKQW